MPISIVSSSSNTSNTGTDISVAMPSGKQTDDLLIVIISHNNDGNVADNNGATPTDEDGDYVGFSGGNGMAVYSRKMTASEPSTWNFIQASSGRWEVIAFLIRGWHGTTVYDVAPSGGNSRGTGSSILCNGITTLTDGALAIAAANIDSNTNGSFSNPHSPTGWTDITRSNSNQPIAVSYKLMTSLGATGNAALACTMSGGGGCGLNVFAIKAPASSKKKTGILMMGA